MTRPRDRATTAGLLPRMEARPHKDGKTVTYRYHPVGGKPVTLGTDRDAAIRRVLDMNGQSLHYGSLAWVWEQWKTSKRWLKLKAGTQADYELAWKSIDAKLGKLPAAGITAPMVARYVHIDRAASPRRADIEKTLMSNLFKHAIMLGVAQVNPTIGVEPHGSTPSEVMPEDATLRAFLAWLEKQDGQRQVIGRMAEFASLVGCRRAEFLDATWAQVDLEGGVLRLPRAKQRGRAIFDAVEITPRLRALLDRLPREGPWLFTTRQGNPYNDRGFKTLWNRCIHAAIDEKVLRADQRFTFHSLRRFYVTTHRAQTGSLPALHADQRVTSRVYDATKEVARRAL